jgi:hypothetical protein
MRMAQIQEIIKLNASLPFFDVVELIDAVFGESTIKHQMQWKKIYNKYRCGKELKCSLNGKREAYYTNESCYGTVDYHYSNTDEVTDFTENCKLSFSERLKITQLYL